MAPQDELTGTINRRRVLELTRTAHEALAHGRPAFCLALMDLDHFKRVNDTYGHPIGDEVRSAHRT